MIFKFSAIAFAALVSVASAQAQEQELSPDLQCLRYTQNYERTLRIPQGLLTAIAFAESGRPAADGRIMPWPWTINVNGRGQFFQTKEEAVAETRRLMDAGERSIDIGCMQVNLRYHPDAFKTVEDAFDPAMNVAYGGQFLLSLHGSQGAWPKAVERYHSSDDGRREEYRERVLAMWNTEAKNVVINAVLAEDTDSPYHRAIRDFVAKRYNESLDKYQGIVDAHPKDRIALLGVAMSYEELGRDNEAMQAYAKYLATEPENPIVRTKVIQKATAKGADAARSDLEALVAAGVTESDVLAALSEVAVSLGDNDAALKYISGAIAKDPQVSAYYLNAGVLADRLNRPAVALQFYEQFLGLYAQRPVFVDASLDEVRQRAKYLRTRL